MTENTEIKVPENTQDNTQVNTQKGSFWRKHGAKIITGVVSLGLLVFIIIMLTGMQGAAVKAAENSYEKSVADAKAEGYEQSYPIGFEWSEAAHHTSNVAHISIEKLEEKSELEVLTVSYDDIEHTSDSVDNVVSNFFDQLKDLIYEDQISLWQKITLKGSYSVNMKKAEFIIDDARSYVLVRLPQPEISKVDIVSSEILYSGEGGLFNQPGEGEELTAQQRSDAQEKALEALQEHEVYIDAAKDSAERFVVNFVKALNPEIKNITVEVEYVK